jgi:hypothetical protein
MRHTEIKYFNLPYFYRPLLEHGGDCMQHNVTKHNFTKHLAYIYAALGYNA